MLIFAMTAAPGGTAVLAARSHGGEYAKPPPLQWSMMYSECSPVAGTFVARHSFRYASAFKHFPTWCDTGAERYCGDCLAPSAPISTT
jgi:hypothetical protein